VPTMGEKAIEKAFALVILGGLGHMPGSIVAGLILGVLESLAIAYVDLPMGRDAIAFVLLIFILICRPYGLFGKAVVKI
jgi:branched-chain amino acid transport system permease protein